MTTLYPGGDNPVTPNLGLALWDMSFEMAENMILIDTAVGSGASKVEINGSVISNPNFNNTTPAAPTTGIQAKWQSDVGGNVSAYVTIPSALYVPDTTTLMPTTGGNLVTLQTPQNTSLVLLSPSGFLGDASLVLSAGLAGLNGGIGGGIFLSDPSGGGMLFNTAAGIQINDALGSVWNSATGGPQGAGTINALGFYINGVAVGTLPLTTLGDILYEDATPKPARLAGNTTATKKYLSQTGTGSASAVPAWAQINYADITGTVPTPPSGSVLWSDLGAAGADLTLANAGNATTFNQTSAVNWKWANTTAATGSVSQSSPIHNFNGKYWDGAASQTDTWTLQNVLTNGTNGASTLTLAHSGSSGTAAVSVPILSTTTVLATSLGATASPASDLWLGTLHVHDANNWNSFEGGSSGEVGFNFYSSKTNALFNLNGIQSLGWLTQTFHVGNADVNLSRMSAGNLSLGSGVAGDSSGKLSLGGITGSCIVSQLATTPNPTVAVLVGSGATTWGYKLVAKDALGSSIASAEVTVSNAANLTNAAANKITIATTPGAQSYDVYRTTVGTSPSTTGKIGNISAANLNNSTFIVDAGVLTLSAAANASGGTTVYTGTLSNIPVNNLIGATILVAGFVTGANNGTFTCTANTTTTLTLSNASGATETHAGTATVTGDGTTAPASNTTGSFKLAAGLVDSTASLGSSGQVLSSTGTATQWIAQSSVASNAVRIQGVAVAAAAATPAPLDTLQYIPANTDWESASSFRMQGAAWSFGSTAIGGAFGFVFASLSGNNVGFQSTTAVGVAATGNLPPMTNCSPSVSTAGSSGGFNVANIGSNPVLGNIRRFKWAIRLTQTASMRIWIGLGTSSGMAPATYRSDTPAAAIVGFRYSTSAGDTKYMCVAQTDNTHQSITAESTATHVDSTTLHVFEVQYNGTSVYYLIDNVLVGTQTTNLPTVVLAPFVFIDNVGATGQPAFDYAYMLIEGRQ